MTKQTRDTLNRTCAQTGLFQPDSATFLSRPAFGLHSLWPAVRIKSRVQSACEWSKSAKMAHIMHYWSTELVDHLWAPCVEVILVRPHAVPKIENKQLKMIPDSS